MNWIALFSHTGSEVANISSRLGRWPNCIITNQAPDNKSINKKVKRREICYTDSKPTLTSYRQLLEDADLVTLHGWMRIIPEKICNEYNILNLHPGLITEYPELKGKDPQKRVFENDATHRGGTKEYSKVGCVIHKCSPLVDSGLTVMERSCGNSYSGEASLTEALHMMAEDMWVELLEERLKC
jgi:folate-dependent phosphoribosylglycinamide formyltransferase PurN